MIVLDASAAIDFLAGPGERIESLAARVGSAPLTHVPELFDIEILSALRGMERSGNLVGARLNEALEALDDFRIRRWSHEELRPRIWDLRQRHSCYDATYVALARMLDLPVVTTDAKLARAIRGDVAVELFA